MTKNHDDSSAVLLGCGWVTPDVAGAIPDVLRHMGRGPRGSTFQPIPDALREQHPGLSAEIARDRGAWIAALAYEQAMRDAGLPRDAVPAERLGLVLGCALAGQVGMIDFANEVRQQSPRFVSPIHFPQTVGNYVAGALARAYGIRGPNLTLASGIASGLDAVVEACDLLTDGVADVIVAGGAEVLSSELAGALADPDSFISEGACLFVLARANHAARLGRRPIAAIRRFQRGAEDGKFVVEASLVSCASDRRAGAVFIEYGIGRCLAALGAASLAAAIGAAQGFEVPVVEHENERAWSGKRLSGMPRSSNQTKTAVAVARADDAHVTMVEVEVLGEA